MISLYSRVTGIISIILFLIVLSSCKSEQPAAQEPEAVLPNIAVRTIIAEQSSPARQVEIMGTVQAAESASIAAKISGNITDIPVSPGSRVKQGDLLASISAGEISAKLMQAQAQLEQATRNYTREQGLLKKNAATVEMVKTLEETKRIAEAAYKEARTMLGYTSITAPFDGIVTKKHASIGDFATPGSPLLQLESESSLQVITHIPESLILEISIGDQLPIYIPAADVRITGIVEEVAPTADPRSRTAPVKLHIPSQDKNQVRAVCPGEPSRYKRKCNPAAGNRRTALWPDGTGFCRRKPDSPDAACKNRSQTRRQNRNSLRNRAWRRDRRFSRRPTARRSTGQPAIDSNLDFYRKMVCHGHTGK